MSILLDISTLFIENTMVNDLLPYITVNIPNTPTQLGNKIQHSTVTTLDTLKHRIKVVQPIGSPFDTLIRKLLQTKISYKIIKFIENYITGCKAYIIEITHPHNVNSKLAFYQVAFFQQYYSTFTLQAYHDLKLRFR